jgi:hypothetical protein
MQNKKRPSLYNYISTHDEAQPIPESERDRLDTPATPQPIVEAKIPHTEKKISRHLTERLERLTATQQQITRMQAQIVESLAIMADKIVGSARASKARRPS